VATCDFCFRPLFFALFVNFQHLEMPVACGEDGVEDIEDLISVDNPRAKTKVGKNKQQNGVGEVCFRFTLIEHTPAFFLIALIIFRSMNWNSVRVKFPAAIVTSQARRKFISKHGDVHTTLPTANTWPVN
jgi:hypothetical protein